MATNNSGQLLMTENMRNLTKALEVVKDNLAARISGLDSNFSDLNQKVELTNQAFNENAIKVTQTLDTEFNRVDKIISRFEDLMNESNKNLNDRITLSEEKQLAWRSEYEDKNHNIFKEMSTALKSMKRQLVKTAKESTDRDEELGRQISDAKKLSEGMFKNLDDKANHLEELYVFKLGETTKVWEANLQIEVDKLLDAMSKNNDNIQSDFIKRISQTKNDLSKQMFDTVDRESSRMKDLIGDTKKYLENATNSKIKDVELRLENQFRNRFDEYRVKLDESLREFTRLKNELEHIKTDYYSALENVKEDMKSTMRRENEQLKAQLVNRIKESKDQLDELMDKKAQAMKLDIELNKEDMVRQVDAAKIDLESQLQTSTNDLKNIIDKNDQIIHSDVNNKMNSLNVEISTMKSYLVERMDEIHESTKSLARALVNEEAANRAKQDEHIIKLFDRKINNLNDFIMASVEQKLDETRIALENKIKDALLDLEEFKRWTIDEFSKVRTEVEVFKQEYYARDYADYLYLLTMQDQISGAFNDVQRQFHETRLQLENMESKQLEKVKDIEEKFDDYKELNERTWEEFITKYEVELLAYRLQMATTEEAIYENMRNMLEQVNKLGGGSDSLGKKLAATALLVEAQKAHVESQDSDNEKRFKKIETDAEELTGDYDGFKKVTEKNFSVTEDALSILSNLINSIDTRTTGESLITNANLELLEQRTAAGVAEVDGRLNLTNEDQKKKFEEAMKKQERRIVEQEIPAQLIAINNDMGNLQNANSKNMKEMTENMQQKLSEHSIQLDNHEQRIKFCEENIEDAGADMKKISGAVAGTNAQVVNDGLSTQAEISGLKRDIASTIKDIFEAIDNVNAGSSSDRSSRPDPALKSKVEKIERSWKDVDKRLDKLEADNKKAKRKDSIDDSEDKEQSKDIKKLKKELADLKKEVEELKKASDGKDGKDGRNADRKKSRKSKKNDSDDSDNSDDDSDNSEDESESDKRGKKRKASRKATMSPEMKQLQKQVSALQKQVSELEGKVAVIPVGGGSLGRSKSRSSDSDSGDSNAISKKKGKPSKIARSKSKNSDDSDDDKLTKDEVDEMIDEKLEDLKKELLEKIEEIENGSKSDKSSKKSKKRKGSDSDDDKNDELKERVDDLEDKIKDLEELEERIKELEENKGNKSEKSSKSDKSNGDIDDKIKDKIEELKDELKDELKEELKDDLKDELKEELKDELDTKKDDDSDSDGGKGQDNQKIWDEIDNINEKLEKLDDIDPLQERVNEMEERIEALEEKDDD